MSEGTDNMSGFVFGLLDAALLLGLVAGVVVFIVKYKQRKKKESDELRSLHISAR